MSISREVLAKYVKDDDTFMESGSRWGLTLIKAADCGATSLWGCESDRLIEAIACVILEEAFANTTVSFDMDNIHAEDYWPRLELYGAGAVLFLDAHTETRSPVMTELDLIAKWQVRPKAILIDDLRCMKGWGVLVDRLQGKLLDMGYRVSYEDGVEPRDIMVGTL